MTYDKHMDISIHSSTQEATYFWMISENVAFISIHASTQEATRAYPPDSLIATISIHASTQEATDMQV